MNKRFQQDLGIDISSILLPKKGTDMKNGLWLLVTSILGTGLLEKRGGLCWRIAFNTSSYFSRNIS